MPKARNQAAKTAAATPAALVVERFARKGLPIGAIAEACGVNVTTVYYWLRPRANGLNAPHSGASKSRGAGGIIPAKHHPALLEAASAKGIRLTPREVVYGR